VRVRWVSARGKDHEQRMGLPAHLWRERPVAAGLAYNAYAPLTRPGNARDVVKA